MHVEMKAHESSFVVCVCAHCVYELCSMCVHGVRCVCCVECVSHVYGVCTHSVCVPHLQPLLSSGGAMCAGHIVSDSGFPTAASIGPHRSMVVLFRR